jgi:hypothetical protein
MSPEHRWYDAHRIEDSVTHAQEIQLQRQASFSSGRPRSSMMRRSSGVNVKKCFNLKGGKFSRELFWAQNPGLLVVDHNLLKVGAIATPAECMAYRTSSRFTGRD